MVREHFSATAQRVTWKHGHAGREGGRGAWRGVAERFLCGRLASDRGTGEMAGAAAALGTGGSCILKLRRGSPAPWERVTHHCLHPPAFRLSF